MALDPEHTAAYFNRGVALFDTGDRAGAIADYSEAIRLFPGSADKAKALINRCLARLASGDYSRAVTDARRAVELAPDKADHQYTLAQSCALAQDPDQACTALSRAIGLDAECRTKASTDPAFDSIRTDRRFHALIQGIPPAAR